MVKSNSNTGKEWTPQDVSKLKELVKGNTPTGLIGMKLGRSEDAIRAKAHDLDVSLKPTNQSPYNRKSKK